MSWFGEATVFLIYRYNNANYGSKLWLSLLPHTGFLFSCDTLAGLEMRNTGLTIESISYEINQYTMSTVIFMNFISCFIFLYLMIHIIQRNLFVSYDAYDTYALRLFARFAKHNTNINENK